MAFVRRRAGVPPRRSRRPDGGAGTFMAQAGGRNGSGAMRTIKCIKHAQWAVGQPGAKHPLQVARESTEAQRRMAIPIMPRIGIYLIPSGHGEDIRFCTVFKATWLAIPLDARRRLLGHWRRNTHADAGRLTPKIELFEHWYRVSHARADTVGVCDLRGNRFRFSAPMVRHMPDKIAAELIAHELAHALQYSYLLLHARSSMSTEAWEAEAREIERTWGFDPCGASAWYFTNKHRLDREGVAAPRRGSIREARPSSTAQRPACVAEPTVIP